MAELTEIAKRVKKGEKVTPVEFAFLIKNDPEALLAFMIANNPGSMNNILRHKLGYDFELPFKPDIKKMQRICQIILDNGNMKEIAVIEKEFVVDKNGISPQLLNAINSLKK